VRGVLVTSCLIAHFGGSAAAQDPEDAQDTEVEAPLVELDRGRLELSWITRDDGKLSATATLRGPTLWLVRRPDPAPEAAPPEPPPDVDVVVRETVPWPTEVDRIEIHDAEIVFVDRTVPRGELLRLHGVDVSIENFSTRREASGGFPMLITARGQIGRAGRILLFATINPWSRGLDFVGRAQITGLHLDELRGFVEEQVGVPTAGTLTSFVEFSVRGSEISSTVRPFLVGVELEAPPDSGLGERIRVGLAQFFADVLTADAAGREALATDVEIEGDLRDPDLGLWNAFTGVLANAFFEGLVAGFSDLPRPR
jgi:hypothetical protein